MRFYNQQHGFYCGVDLHARMLALCILDDQGRIVFEGKLAAGPEAFRLVRCSHESAGKKLGSGGKKIGNAHLKWAFGEAACLLVRASDQAKQWLADTHSPNVPDAAVRGASIPIARHATKEKNSPRSRCAY